MPFSPEMTEITDDIGVATDLNFRQRTNQLNVSAVHMILSADSDNNMLLYP